MKQLPYKLQNLKLDFYNNNLGKNIENIKYFIDCIKYLPKNLEYLEIDLSYNILGEIRKY